MGPDPQFEQNCSTESLWVWFGLQRYTWVVIQMAELRFVESAGMAQSKRTRTLQPWPLFPYPGSDTEAEQLPAPWTKPCKPHRLPLRPALQAHGNRSSGVCCCHGSEIPDLFSAAVTSWKVPLHLLKQGTGRWRMEIKGFQGHPFGSQSTR